MSTDPSLPAGTESGHGGGHLDRWAHAPFNERVVWMVAVAVLARVAVDWLVQLFAIPTRAMWVDELLNFSWAWARAPHWYPHHLTWLPHAFALLPLRLIDGDPTNALMAYRYVNWLALPLCVAPALWYAGRGLATAPRLVVAAGAGSLLWVWATADVARHNIWAIVGLAWLLADDGRSWRSAVGFLLTLLYPHVAIFALFFVGWRSLAAGRPRRIVAVVLAFAVAALPSMITVYLGVQGERVVGAAFNSKMPEAVMSMHPPISVPADPPRGLLLITLLTAVGLMASLRGRDKWWRVWLPAWGYVIFLGALGSARLPIIVYRYLAPVVMFAWLWATPLLLRQTPAGSRRLAIVALLAALQAFAVIPSDVHWEAVTLPPSRAAALRSALDPCVVEVGGSMLEIIVGLDVLLSSRAWRIAQPGCEVRLAGDCTEWVFSEYEPRFGRLFAPAGFTGRPASVRLDVDFGSRDLCPIDQTPTATGCQISVPPITIQLVNPTPAARAYCEAAS